MEVDWASLSDQELLERRISELGLRIEGTALEPLIRQLYDELSAHGLAFYPPVHIGDEWFVPVGMPAIFVPFLLVHDRLRALERTMMLEVEGGTTEWFMKLMRHEAAHAYAYAYQLPRKKKWRQIFGRTSREETPDSYRPRPFSRSYVVNLDDWYAQSHPDEDFAETFAVWLRPRSHWRTRYADWPALKKLEYVDELMEEIAGKRPALTHREKVDPLSTLTQTLGEYYKKKRALYLVDTPKTYDRDLRRLFSDDPKHYRSEAASSFIRRNRASVRELVAKWTGEYQLTFDAVLDDMIQRCRELNLRAIGPERKLLMEFTVLLTAKTMHALFGPSRRRWIAL